MLNPLEAEGLIERANGAAPTAAGTSSPSRRSASAASPAPRKHIAKPKNALFSSLSDQQRDQLRDQLIALRDANGTQPAGDDCEQAAPTSV
jgi:hypothetical protein